jgi:hypothetical protein
MLAIALGRPLGVNDSDCDVELPVDVDDEYLPEYFSGANVQKRPSLMTGIVALIKLYEIGGRVLRQVYSLEICKDHLEQDRKTMLQQTVEALDVELTKWCDELPIVFKSQSETDEQVSMGAVLCSHYYSMLTTLHRNLLPVKRDQPVTAKSTAKAVSSARSCIRLAPSMKHVVPPSHHLAFFIQHLFSSAVIVLLYAMHASDPRAAGAAMDESRSTLAALESWEGQWPGAKKCKDLLVDLVTTASEAIAHGKAFSTTTPTQATNTGPPASPTSNHERRRSVTIVNPVATTSTGRTAKGRRRNQSRDPGTSGSRRMAAVSPYRVDGGKSVFLECTRLPTDPLCKVNEQDQLRGGVVMTIQKALNDRQRDRTISHSPARLWDHTKQIVRTAPPHQSTYHRHRRLSLLRLKLFSRSHRNRVPWLQMRRRIPIPSNTAHMFHLLKSNLLRVMTSIMASPR